QSLTEDSHRRLVIAGIVAVSLAYLIMFAIVFDYSRWISNWAVCLFLILHAVKTLPGSKEVRLISTNDPRITLFGWIVTLIPRVGVMPCRSSRASISFRPRESCARSRRPSGASGGVIGFVARGILANGSGLGGTAAFAAAVGSICAEATSVFPARGFLRSGLI